MPGLKTGKTMDKKEKTLYAFLIAALGVYLLVLDLIFSYTLFANLFR
jgi:hypothetical protein